MSKFLRSNYDTDSKRSLKRRWVETSDVDADERDVSGVSGPDEENTDRETQSGGEYKKFASEFTQTGEQYIQPNPIIRKKEPISKDKYRNGDWNRVDDGPRNGGNEVRNRVDDGPRNGGGSEAERQRNGDVGSRNSEAEKARNVEISIERRRQEIRRREEEELGSGGGPIGYQNLITTTSQSRDIPVVNCYCTCKCKERVVYVEGPSGPQGPQGRVGPAGEGSEGPQGKMGFAGQDGRDGINGKRGAKGPPGATGAQGQTGEQGVRGFEGKAGAQGPQGPQGRNGIDGRDAVCVCSKDPLHRGSVIRTRFITNGGRRTLNPDDTNVIIDSASTVVIVLPPSPIVADSRDVDDYYIQSTCITICAINGIHTINTNSSDTKINSFMNSIVIGNGNKYGSGSNVLKFFSDGRGSWISH